MRQPEKKFFGIPQSYFSTYEQVAVVIFIGIVCVCAFFEIEGTPLLYLHAHAWLWFFALLMYVLAFGRPLADLGTVEGALTKQCMYYLVLVIAVLILGFISIGRLTSPPFVPAGQTIPTSGYYTLLIGVVSAMMVGLGWLVQFSMTAKAQRRQHTIKVLLDSRMSAEFQRQMDTLRLCYRMTDVIPMDDVKWAFGENSRNIPAEDHEKKKKYEAILANNYLLNFYEFLAVGIRYQDMDEQVLKDVLRAIAINLYKRSVNVISYWQEQKPSIHCEFIELVKRWENDG